MDFIALFYCLSRAASPEAYVKYFQDNLEYLVSDVRTAVTLCLQSYQDNGCFPDFLTIHSCFNLDEASFSHDALIRVYGDVGTATEDLWSKFRQMTNKAKADSLRERMAGEPSVEKHNKLLSEYTNLVMSGSREAEDYYTEDSDIEVAILKSQNDAEGLTYPIAKLNDEQGPLGVGQSLVVLAAPGSFKTTFALNMVFQNSIARGKVGAYFYLEDRKESYKKKLISRTSMAYGTKVHKDILLTGTDDDHTARIVEGEIARYKAKLADRLVFMTMGRFSSDPYAFAQQLGKAVTERKIDYLVFDYAQRMSAFIPPHASRFEYLNLFFATLSSLALGNFNNRPFSLVVLSQLTKEGIKRADKSGGRLTVADAAEISSLERDAFLMVSLWADDALKRAGQVNYQVLKSRNGITTTDPIQTFVDPEYVYLGDVPDLQDVFSPTAVSDNFALEELEV